MGRDGDIEKKELNLASLNLHTSGKVPTLLARSLVHAILVAKIANKVRSLSAPRHSGNI